MMIIVFILISMIGLCMLDYDDRHDYDDDGDDDDDDIDDDDDVSDGEWAPVVCWPRRGPDHVLQLHNFP